MPDTATEQHPTYQRMARAIAYMQAHYQQQPSLQDVAASVHLSPQHFQRVFSQWAGVSPKKFIQHLSLQQAKTLLQQQASVLDTAHTSGLSGSGRLHDLFIQLEGMTPGEYKNGGARLNIAYEYADSPLGRLLLASTDKGLCHLHFIDDEQQALNELQVAFPQAQLHAGHSALHQQALRVFTQPRDKPNSLRLHLRGTPFQLKVWQGLLRIPAGQLRSYGTLAHELGCPQSARAVGTAIGRNPVAYLIPCHRVIQASGQPGGYRWGVLRKRGLLAQEIAQQE